MIFYINFTDSLQGWDKRLSLASDSWSYQDQEMKLELNSPSARGYHFWENMPESGKVYGTPVDEDGVPVDVLDGMQYVNIDGILYKGAVNEIALDELAFQCEIVEVNGNRVEFRRPLPFDNGSELEGYIEFASTPELIKGVD